GYKTFMARIRNNHPGALMGNEGKYEQLIPYLEGFFEPLWTGSGGPTQNDRPFCMPGAFPVPVVQCVYHDYIIPFGSNGSLWEDYVSGQYAFEQAFAFVNGNLINVKIDASPLSQYQPEKGDDMRFSRQMVQTFPYAKQYLRYGEWMRPPEVTVPTTIVHFAFDYPMYESIEQPKILSACFKAYDGSLGLAFANYTTESVSGSFSVNLENYGIASGNYSVNIIDTSGVFAFDQFNGSTYTNQLNMPSKSVLLFQIGLSTGVPKMDALKAFDFELNQNYPNPFNAKTIIRFSLSKQQHIRLKIFNLVGQEISELINEQMEAGEHSIHFDASKLESGIYFYRLISENHTSTNKMVLVK
ncbi:T9SS type A sorting domain-containing protein, partial [candidate division KSB1 bacterium]|nr:T9SS type A sorting domain-containing protein [candidate division KSB1 bacterium]